MKIWKNKNLISRPSWLTLFLWSIALWICVGPVPLSARYINTTTIKLDDAGNSVAVWEVQTGDDHAILASTKSLAGSWTEPEIISEEGKDSSGPLLDVNDSGNAVVVWIVKDAGVRSLYVSTLVVGGSWSDPTLLSSGKHDVTTYSVSTNKRHDVATIWSEDVDGSDFTYFSNTSLGSGWNNSLQALPRCTKYYKDKDDKGNDK